MHTQCRAIVAALIVGLFACGREDTPPGNPHAPPGEAKKLDTKLLEKGAENLQDLSPIRSLDHYLDGFHVMRDDTRLHMEAHHFCKGMNEEFTQCVIFDGNTKESNIIGIEYIVSESLFESMPEEEKQSWHPHNYEILSGQLVMPGVPAVAEKAALEKKLNSYGKTWHVWDTGHAGHPAAHSLPVGKPMLAWSYNRDGEVPRGLVEARDRRMKLDTSEKRRERAHLAAKAKPQVGADALSGKLGGTGAPPGVTSKQVMPTPR
jgi:hypothetical protein